MTMLWSPGERHRRRGRNPRVSREACVARALSQQSEASRTRLSWAYARISPSRHEPPRSPDPPEGMLQRLREAHRRTGVVPSQDPTWISRNNTYNTSENRVNPYLVQLKCPRNSDKMKVLCAGHHRVRPDMASWTLHLRTLQPGARHKELLRARRQAILRAWLSQSVLASMRLLQRTHSGRQCPLTVLDIMRYNFYGAEVDSLFRNV